MGKTAGGLLPARAEQEWTKMSNIKNEASRRSSREASERCSESIRDRQEYSTVKDSPVLTFILIVIVVFLLAQTDPGKRAIAALLSQPSQQVQPAPAAPQQPVIVIPQPATQPETAVSPEQPAQPASQPETAVFPAPQQPSGGAPPAPAAQERFSVPEQPSQPAWPAQPATGPETAVSGPQATPTATQQEWASQPSLDSVDMTNGQLQELGIVPGTGGASLTPGQLANCAYAQSTGRRASPLCPANAAELLGQGR